MDDENFENLRFWVVFETRQLGMTHPKLDWYSQYSEKSDGAH